MISLGGGMPHPSTFPFTRLSAELEDGSVIEIAGKHLEAALQYSPTAGLPRLVEHLRALQVAEHNIDDDRALCVATGSQDAIAKAFDALLDADDALLVESPTYSGALAYLQPIGCTLVGIHGDSNGLDPEALESRLRDWDASKEGGTRRPRVIYIVPSAANPTGATLDLGRRQRIYSIAREYDLLILEDDPYHWLQYGGRRIPSFLSLDRDNRVLRFDSFSKLLSSGMRLGWATGPKALIERIELHTQAANLHPCGLSQALAAGLFDEWASRHGDDPLKGFRERMAMVAAFYEQRCITFLKAAEKHLNGLATWTKPTAGMFVWLDLRPSGVLDAQKLISERAISAKVLLVPGTSFMPQQQEGQPSSQVRAAFSTATPEEMDEACRRLAGLLREG